MIPIQFHTRQQDHIRQYILPSNRQCFLDLSAFHQASNLDDEGLEQWTQLQKELGLTIFANEENSLLYAIALRKLTAGRPLGMGWMGNPKEIEQHFPDAEIIRCEWLPCLEFTIDDQDCRDFGCLRPAEFMRMVNYSNQSLQHRYDYLIVLPPDEVQRYIHLYGSDVTNWTFLIGDQLKEAIARLTDPSMRPSIADLLQNLDCLVQLQVGEDEGYLDYCRISTSQNRDAEIAAIALKMNQFAEEYEALLSEILPLDEDWKVESIGEFVKAFLSD